MQKLGKCTVMFSKFPFYGKILIILCIVGLLSLPVTPKVHNKWTGKQSMIIYALWNQSFEETWTSEELQVQISSKLCGEIQNLK